MGKTVRHNCDPESKMDRLLWKGGYGGAIYPGDMFWADEEGCWLLGNGEYYSEVFYCPWCGDKLEPPQNKSDRDR